MKRWDLSRVKLRVSAEGLDDKLIVLNLYLTQAATVVIAGIVLLIQRSNPLRMLILPSSWDAWAWGIGFGMLVLGGDVLISRWMPAEAADDGGINELLFGNRVLWHIAVMSLIVAFCEELLFRGAVQHAFGPYWTSIVFAAIHIRYLRHWLMTGMVFGVSYGLGWIYLRTGTLWTPIVAHFVIDFVMGCIIRYRGSQHEQK